MQEQYRQFCATAPIDFPIFSQAWYLDAVCENGQWDAAVVEMAGQVVAVWPYFLKKKGPWNYVAMPVLVKFMGPYLVPERRSTTDQMRLIEQLLAQIPAGLAAFQQDFHYFVNNWLPLYWTGFRQTTRYSYTIDLTQSEAVLWQGINADYRNNKIKRAQEIVDIRHDLPLAELYRVHNLSFERQDLKPPFSFAFLEKTAAALNKHQAGMPFFAVDKVTGQIHATAYLVWDKHSAYLLLSGSDPALRASGATILLTWAVIQYAKNTLQVAVFDFEGSMIRAVEQGCRRFGAAQQPYFRLQREWSVWWRWGKILWR